MRRYRLNVMVSLCLYMKLPNLCVVYEPEGGNAANEEWFVLFQAHLSKWNTFVINTPVNNNQICSHDNGFDACN